MTTCTLLTLAFLAGLTLHRHYQEDAALNTVLDALRTLLGRAYRPLRQLWQAPAAPPANLREPPARLAA